MFLGTDLKCWSDEGQTDTQISNCRKVLPICPAWCGGVRVRAGIHALPLEDAHVLSRLALQPDGVLVEGGRVVKLVVHVLDQAVQLSPWLQDNKFASLSTLHRCLNQKIICCTDLVGSHIEPVTDYSDMICENLSFKRTLTEFDIEGEDYSPCKSNSNCPKSLHHHPLGHRLCRDGCPTLILTWYRNENHKRFNADVKTACVGSVWSGCVHPWV